MILRVKTCLTCWIAWKNKKWVKSGEIAKIEQNCAKSRFQDRFCDFAKMRHWNKIPPSCPAVRRLLDFSCIVTDSRGYLQSSLQAKILTIHNQSSQITTYKILFPTEQIPNWQPQKRRQRSPSSTKTASDSAHGPVTPFFTPSLSSVLTVAASSSVYRDFNHDEPTMISSTAHGFRLPLQFLLTVARRQWSAFFPIFNNSRRHRAVGPLHQQPFSSSSSSSTAAVQLIINSSRSAHHHHLQQQQATP